MACKRNLLQRNDFDFPKKHNYDLGLSGEQALLTMGLYLKEVTLVNMITDLWAHGMMVLKYS